MTVFEHAGRLLDRGLRRAFPEQDQPGVDLILPDFSALEDRLDQIEALVLTHAHEDHIGGGAVPAAPAAPTSRSSGPGSRWRWSRSKLIEHRITPADDRGRSRRQRRASARTSWSSSSVNHSIPDALAVAIRTPAGLVLHTGDFKMDQLPLDGRLTDLGGFARLGADGVDLLLADSTNAEVPGIVDLRAADRAGAVRRVRRGRRSGSSCPASPATCTGCSR